MPESENVDPKVHAALKASIETNLARKAVRAEAVASAGGAVTAFSNGVIFSKATNGTPFSNGVFFSKTGAALERLGDDPAEQQLIEELVSFDEAAFNSFTNRLTRLKQAKAQGH